MRMFAPFSCSVSERNDDAIFNVWNTVNNEESQNSQSSKLEEEDIQKLEADSEPVNNNNNNKKTRVIASRPMAKCM